MRLSAYVLDSINKRLLKVKTRGLLDAGKNGDSFDCARVGRRL